MRPAQSNNPLNQGPPAGTPAGGAVIHAFGGDPLTDGIETPQKKVLLRVLHLEDNPDDAELIRALLKTNGFECCIVAARNKSQFEQAIEDGVFDLILSDYALPDYDGFSALRLAREKQPDAPFILVSGTLGEEQAVESLKSGATDYILKTRLVRLPSAVRRALREAAARLQCQRIDDELRRKTALLEALVDSSPDGILVVNGQGEQIVQNEQLNRLLKIPAHIVAQKDDRERLEHVVNATRFPTQFRERVAYLYAHADETGMDEIEFKDGTILDRYSAPVRGKDGIHYGRIWMFRDITERKHAEEVLRESNQKFRQFADNISDVFWIRSPDLNEVQYISPAFERIWGQSVESLYANPKQWADFILPEDRERVLSGFAALTGDTRSLDVEYRIVRPDGEIRWVRVRGFQVRDTADKLLRHIGIVTDITEAKRSEADLKILHKELVDASRQAGMAEVATGVLHNVGNVLNSVNVASSCLADSLRKSKAANLSKVVAMLAEHEADLGTFLTNDPKGKLLPTYLAQLAEHLAGEQAAALKELAGLQKNIEYIKDIVSMQQGFAKQSGLVETLQLTDLVEDALKMNSSALARTDIQIVKDFNLVPPIPVEKHKVMQILVNLVCNAQQACEDSERPDKRLTLRVTNGHEHVRVAVGDNGIGIAPENLTRIFRHGFTTKKDGHGFGLHSGALAAREMGGSLTVHSAGSGRAQFLPLNFRWNHCGSTWIDMNDNRNLRILIVDDNRAIHEDFRKIFNSDTNAAPALTAMEAGLFGDSMLDEGHAAFEFDSAFQGEEAIVMAQQALNEGRPYSMAFVDVRMPPGCDGIETISRIWRDYPDLQVVLCTAYSDYSLDEILKKLGHSDQLVILKKPFDNIEVLQLAYALTEKWQLLQLARAKTDELERRVNERTRELQLANEKLLAEMRRRAQAEEGLRQAQKMEAIGQLAGGIAHDFNNILTVIRGYTCCLLEDEQFDANAHESLRQVDGAAERAASLTRQLLTFSRKQLMQRENLDLNEVIDQVTKMLVRVLGEDIALQILIAPRLQRIDADRAMIEQIILNLAVNARDAMPNGGRLVISTAAVEFSEQDAAEHTKARAGQFACVSVTDTGCGIAPDVLPHLFEPFFTTKEVGKGTGLGLATVYGIVKQHGGWIDVESTPGHGATFKIHLPVNLKPVEAVAVPSQSAKALGGNETILLVEDEPILRALVRTALQRYGYRVFTANSGLDALKLWSDHGGAIDLLLTDMVMPDGVSGGELVRKLQAEKPALRVIYSSGYSPELLGPDHALASGLNFLPKPYTPEKLAKVVRDCLDTPPPAPVAPG